MATAVVAAAAVAMKVRRQIVSYFLAMHALSAEDAVAYAPDSAMERRQFAWLRENAMLIEAEPGKYWVDLARYNADRARRQSRAAVMTGILLMILGLALLLVFYVFKPR